LLSVDESDARTKEGSNWVLTLRSSVKKVGLVPGIFNPTSTLIARVTFGVGGITQVVEVDTFNSVISIPSETVFVDLLQTQIAPAAGPSGTPDSIFEEVEVFGTINKGIESGSGIPLRSYFINGPTPGGWTVPVPPFATAWCYLPALNVDAASLPILGNVRVQSAGLNQPHNRTIELVIPEVSASMARMHCFRDLPSEAESINLNLTNNTWYGSLIFQIGL